MILTFRTTSTVQSNNGAFAIDSDQVQPDKLWLLETVIAWIWTSAGAADLLGNGIFLMQPNSPAFGGVHGADATFLPQDANSRGIALPLDITSYPAQPSGNGGPQFPQVWRFVAYANRIIIPPNAFLRAIIHGAFSGGAVGFLACSFEERDANSLV